MRNLVKIYPLYEKNTDRLKEALSPAGHSYHRETGALRGISFDVRRGEAVGIIGLNGSGKSTLLKILTGVLAPSSGEAEVRGRISSLLELGAGFNPEYTGRENVRINAAILGLSGRENAERMREIIEFADIGPYIDQPVRTYSSGMFVRLAFATAASVSPDILMIDEALSVGDVFFQQKCFRRIREFRESCTVLMVSHDLNVLTRFCPRILLLHQGRLLFDGNAAQAVTEYYRVRQGAGRWGSADWFRPRKTDMPAEKWKPAPDEKISGRGRIRIEAFRYFVDGTAFAESVTAGQEIHMELQVRTGCGWDQVIVGYQVLDRCGTEIFGETSVTSFPGAERELEPGRSLVRISFRWPEIREGDYFITPGIGNGPMVLDQTEECWLNQGIHLISHTAPGRVIFGMFNVPMEEFQMAEKEEKGEEGKK